MRALRTRAPILIAAVAAALTMAVGAAASATTLSGVLTAVRQSLSITQVPPGLTPSLTDAVNRLRSPTVTGANYILTSCDPYWVHTQAQAPIPCWYGDRSAKKTVVLFGDSNAGNWAPAFDQIFKQLGYRLALFGFIGCTTAPVNESATSQPGYPGQWQYCNTWHLNLPAAVRALKPVAIISASSPLQHLDASERAGWVNAMRWAYTKMTIGNPSAARVEMGTTPVFPSIVPDCLASVASVQQCDATYSSPLSQYAALLVRDQAIARVAKAKLIPAWQWFCYSHMCSPVVEHYMTVVDQDHTSTPYVEYLEGVIKSAFLARVKLH